MRYTLRLVFLATVIALLQGCSLKGGSIPAYNTIDVHVSVRPDPFTSSPTNLTRFSVVLHYHYNADGDTLICNDVLLSRSDDGGQYILLQPGWAGNIPTDANTRSYQCTYHHAGKDLLFSVPIYQPLAIVPPQAGQTIHAGNLEVRFQAMVDKVSLRVVSDDGKWSSMGYTVFGADRYTIPLAGVPNGAGTLFAEQAYSQMLTGTPFHSVTYDASVERRVPIVLGRI